MSYLSEEVQAFLETCEAAERESWDIADIKSHILLDFPYRFRQAMELDYDG